MDGVSSLYDNQFEIIKKHLEQSFRTSFLQYKEILGNYMSQCLKVLSVSVSQITYSDAITKCIDEGFLPK